MSDRPRELEDKSRTKKDALSERKRWKLLSKFAKGRRKPTMDSVLFDFASLDLLDEGRYSH
jgi:hypothetical protein